MMAQKLIVHHQRGPVPWCAVAEREEDVGKLIVINAEGSTPQEAERKLMVLLSAKKPISTPAQPAKGKR
jgi:hypothetical protein